MVLVHAVEGRSQDRLQSLPDALHHSNCRFKFGRRTVRDGNWAGLLSKRTKLNKLLVQFAYDVNYFFPANIEMLALHRLGFSECTIKS